MKTLHYFTFVLIGLGVFAFINRGNGNSSGANPSNAGAPNEMTCARSGCHDDHGVNSGAGVLRIKPSYDGDRTTTYRKNATYTIKLTLTDQQMNAAGFQIVAQRTDNNQFVGNFTVGSDMRKVGANNNYLTHSQKATSYESNVQVWTIEWESPSQDVGEIRFYAAANAANNNSNNTGDFIYSNDTSLTFEPASGRPELSVNELTKVYPNPVRETLNITLPEAVNTAMEANLLALNGQSARSLGHIQPQGGSLQMQLPASLEQGAYLLELSNAQHQIQKRILVE